MNLRVSKAELKKRAAKWRKPPAKIKDGYLVRYAQTVTSAAQGAVHKDKIL